MRKTWPILLSALVLAILVWAGVGSALRNKGADCVQPEKAVVSAERGQDTHSQKAVGTSIFRQSKGVSAALAAKAVPLRRTALSAEEERTRPTA